MCYFCDFSGINNCISIAFLSVQLLKVKIFNIVYAKYVLIRYRMHISLFKI
jgi:hypothetical protein